MKNQYRLTCCLTLFIPVVMSLVVSAIAAAADDTGTTEVKAGGLTLNVPASWKHEEPLSRLRLTQFRIPAADGDKEDGELAVFSFGAGGGVKANIERWIGQFQPDGRTVKIVTGKATQGQYVLVDVAGVYNKPVGPPIAGKTEPTPGSRVLAVILTVPEKDNFFLKLTGPDKTVAAQATALRASFGGDAKDENELALEE